MGSAAVSRDITAPWAVALLNDPNWTRAKSASRIPKDTGEDSFFAETLATNRTIRSFTTLKPTKELDNEFAYNEIRIIVDVGDGLMGYPKILHGGFVATMLDEVCGALIVLNMEKKMERLKKTGPAQPHTDMAYMTAYLNTIYKKPVPAPGTVLCTAKLERHNGRKLYVRATIEDGAGTVFTIGEALFIEFKAKLSKL